MGKNPPTNFISNNNIELLTKPHTSTKYEASSKDKGEKLRRSANSNMIFMDKGNNSDGEN